MAERDRKPNEREDADANDDAKPRALTLAKPPVGTREASSSTVPAPVHIPIEAPVRAARALRDEVRAVFERGRKVKRSSDGAEGGARGRTPREEANGGGRDAARRRVWRRETIVMSWVRNLRLVDR